MRRQNSPTWELDKEIKHFDIGTDSGTKVAARSPLGHIQRFKGEIEESMLEIINLFIKYD